MKFFKQLSKALAVVGFAALVATGCTEQVPAGYLGKIVSPSGVTPEVYSTGRPTVMFRDELVLVETASQLQPAKISVIMNDRVVDSKGVVTERIGLVMDFILNIRYRINPSKTTINTMLSDMTLDGVKTIGAKQVYHKYGNMVVGRVSREVLGSYTPEEVLNNLKSINAKLSKGVAEGLEGSPLIISEVSLGPITLPQVISQRINKNKEVELSEAEKRADQKINLLEKKNLKALATQQASIDLIDAQSLAAQNKVLRQSITPEVLELRRMEIQKMQLEVFKVFAEKGTNNTLVLPYEALGSAGAQMKMYNNK